MVPWTAMRVDLPPFLCDVRYNGAVHPGVFSGVAQGINCQVFAYLLLEHAGWAPPWLRSSELWADTTATEFVGDAALEPYDLLLFTDRSAADAYGAHVTVYAGDHGVVHLARHHGTPRFESMDAILATPRYRCFIGAKRCVLRS